MKWKRKILKILKAKNYNIAEQQKKKRRFNLEKKMDIFI